jgi:uncharacterized protein (DUF2461 family)
MNRIGAIPSATVKRFHGFSHFLEQQLQDRLRGDSGTADHQIGDASIERVSLRVQLLEFLQRVADLQ